MSDCTTTVAELRKLVADFVAERRWERFHDPKNLAMALTVEAGELMEHFQWLRSEELAGAVASPETLAAVGEELADVACYLFALANVLKLDVAASVRDKMAKNIRKYPASEFQGTFEKR